MTYKEQNRVVEMPRISCENVDELASLYVDGDLDLSVCRRFEQHLAQCSSCRDTVSELEHLVATAASIEDAPIPSDVQSRLREALQHRVGYKSSSRTHQVQLRLITNRD